MNEIWNAEYECMTRDELRELQFKRLQMTLRWVYENVPFHRERWSAMKLKPSDIRSLDDIRKLPFTVKSDFKAAYPYELFALPLEKVIRIHASSGTMSNPTVVGYSRGDLSTWSELCARVAVAGGARFHDVAQISCEYGLTTGAFGMHAGLERVGVTVIPAGTGNTNRQLQIMQTERRGLGNQNAVVTAAHGFNDRAGRAGRSVNDRYFVRMSKGAYLSD